ncbi:polyketide synthetase [Byssothecium circinans]|uniref:Polyketide synthetase n=1 Tax=Byssothecium circinans TaxID=147558 RepID=A0A6A5THF6_9PLEO|nr:polyketide synthetase [Byssothecium circinans]
MSRSNRIYVFGDQTFDYEQSLAQLLRSDNVILNSFFQKCSSALQTELGRLPLHARDTTPKFSSVADLLTRKRDGCISAALEQALCLIHTFAAFIWQHSEGGFAFPTSQDSKLVGFCTGAFAAAAISSSQDLVQLIPAAVHATVVALHTGLRSEQENLTVDGSSSSRCSMVVLGASENEIASLLERFNSRNSMPSSSKAYISAVLPAGLTISGPPHVLTELKREDAVSKLETVTLPIRSPYHAPHLFSEEDINTVVQKAHSWAPITSKPFIPLLSCGTGNFTWAETSQAMLECAIRDVLSRPMVMDKAINSLSVTLKAGPPKDVQLVPIGTDTGETVRRRLKSALVGHMPIDIDLASQAMAIPAGNPTGRSKIAVIGMSGRFPGASSTDALWEVLENKMDMCREVPELRWNAKTTHVDSTGRRKNTSKVRWGCWLEEPDLFDASFFSISPREAPQVDPAQRLALMTAYEAIEDAGIVPNRTPSTREDRVGVFYGVTSNDWCESNSGQDIDAYYIPGANRAFIPGRINYFFKFSGPSFAVDTACSSSLAAIHLACNLLWKGDVDTAIAGGTNVLTNPDMTTGLDKGHFLSATGNCKTFDESADGYCRGEGVATVVLKRLEDALEDGDPIHGVIGSAYTNHSAEAESITRPHVGAQKGIFERVLNDSGTNAYDVGYVEMHGTGTQAGDTREMNSVCDVLAPMNKPHKRPADQPLHLGALKSNIGHGESVSGVSALIKVIMMMKKGMIPPHCGIKTRINPAFPQDLAERNVHIDFETTAWPRSRGLPRKALINNFSAAGGNTSILVEEPMTTALIQAADGNNRPIYPVAISARCAKSLRANIQALLAHLSKSEVSLPKLSYTTTARRMHHQHRVILASQNIESLKSQLTEAINTEQGSRRVVPPRHMLFAFTGQGSQYPGMGKQLLESLNAFRDQIIRFDQLARRLGFPGIMSLFKATSGDDIAQYPPVVVQLANICMQIALARIWISWGIIPTAVVGHSLGEYAALNIAGVLSDSDTVFLVGRRAQHLQDMCSPATHSMLAVLASVSEIENATRSLNFEIACINGPKETVLAGTATRVLELQQTLAAAGIRGTLIKVPYAFHSSQVTPILNKFSNDAQGVVFRKPQIPVLSPLFGTTVQDGGVFGPDYLARHAREPVQIMRCLQTASAEGLLTNTAYAIEFGPHPVVSGMIKSTLGTAITTLPTLRRNNDPWDVLTKSLCSLYSAGLPIKWDGYFTDIPSARTVIGLPAYSWDLKSYWIAYRNDWTLTKGDIPIDLEPPKLESSTIHKVLKEEITTHGYNIVVDCDINRDDVAPFIKSHKVDGFDLCTPAVYADISFSIGTYVLERFQPHFPERIVNIIDMDIRRALIGSAEWKQSLRCTAMFDWATKGAKVSFTVHDESGNEIGQLSACEIKFVDDSERQRLQRNMEVEKAHFDRMRRQCAEGTTCRFNGPMAYRLVSALAQFNPDYHCIDEVLYDSASYEAACVVSFGQMKKGGTFHVNPGAVDGLTQSGGFVMNANERTKLETDVFVNHGWNEFQLFERIRDDCQYSTHVRMTPGEEQLWSGDISIFSGDRAVGVVKGIRIQGIPRRLLKFVLSQAAKPPKSKVKDTKSTGPTSRPVQQAAPTAPPAARVAPVKHVPAVEQSREDSSPEAGSTMAKALEIISEQSGVPVSELRDDTRFADIGIDSLLSLMITSLFAEELGINADSTLFLENGSIADIRKVFEPSNSSAKPTKFEPAEHIGAVSTVPAAVTPVPQQQVLLPVQRVISNVAYETSNSTVGKFDDVLKIISEEAEVPLEQLTDDTSLAELGVDSLLSLMIGSRLRDELELDVDTHSMLTSLDSICALREAIYPTEAKLSEDLSYSSSTSSTRSGSAPPSMDAPGLHTPFSEIDFPIIEEDVPPATSFVLQGNPRTTSRILFFFPDGSGLASSYASLPRISDDLVVYGLNSPYLKKGIAMNCSWDGLVGSFLAEVRRRQPHGPYSFAGWSAGGIIGFRAAQILMGAGEIVNDLIIIDSPPPENLKPLPEHFFKYCSTANLFGSQGGTAPHWVIAHFRSINHVLSSYFAAPLTVSTLRKVNIIWACESSVDDRFHPQPDDPEDMKFLTEKRTDFTAGKWGRLFPGVPVQIERAVGRHHWNILKDESAAKVAAYIARVLA